MVPGPDDLIVDPGVLRGEDCRRSRNRTILKVVGRYLQPQRSDDGRVLIALLLCSRPGQEVETDILGF